MTFDFSELATIIELNSYTRDNKAGVDENGAIVQSWLEPLGYKTTQFKREHIGNHFLFESPKREGEKLLLLGHLDTVYPAGTFTDFSEDDEWIYGPGVCDMKGGYYLAICALRAIYEQQGRIANIDVFLVSDEETGSDDSKLVTSEIAKNYDACLDFEAAGKNNEVVIGRKGVATWHITLSGKAAHAGNHYVDGHNANLAAAHMLIELQALTNLERGSTVNVGKMSGGIGANTISPEAKMIVEARFTNSDERERLLTQVEAIANKPFVDGVSLTLEGGLQRDVMQPTEGQQALLAKIESVLGYALPTEQRGGVSDANTVSAVGVPTLDGFGPFGDGDHTIHERASKQSFVNRLDEVTKILAAFNAG
jgi:glutamate carboxypeptidase